MSSVNWQSNKSNSGIFCPNLICIFVKCIYYLYKQFITNATNRVHMFVPRIQGYKQTAPSLAWTRRRAGRAELHTEGLGLLLWTLVSIVVDVDKQSLSWPLSPIFNNVFYPLLGFLTSCSSLFEQRTSVYIAACSPYCKFPAMVPAPALEPKLGNRKKEHILTNTILQVITNTVL